MIDLHSHILPNIDDGSKNMEQSIQMLKEACTSGFKTICCTPHYFDQRYIKTREENIENIAKLRAKALEENIDIELVLGNEIFISDKTIELLENKTISTIGDSKYVLVELPMNQEIKYLSEVFYEIKEKGYKIIVAHPERYSYVQKNPNYLIEFINNDIYFQSNYASILGVYGKAAQKTVKKLLKNNFIQLLATDTHRNNSIYTKMDNIIKKIKKITSEEYFNVLVNENPKLVLKNEDLAIIEPKRKKRFFWEKYY